MISMLRDVVERGTGAPARALGVRGPVGGKTGTTDDYRDAWFVGFSSSVVVGVWVGFDQPAPIGRDAYGARVALPIWADFMKRDRAPAAGARLRGARRRPRRRALQRVVSAAGRRLSGLHRVSSRTATRCRPRSVRSIAASLKQRASRAIDGFFRGLGGKIAGIFRRMSTLRWPSRSASSSSTMRSSTRRWSWSSCARATAWPTPRCEIAGSLRRGAAAR